LGGGSGRRCRAGQRSRINERKRTKVERGKTGVRKRILREFVRFLARNKAWIGDRVGKEFSNMGRFRRRWKSLLIRNSLRRRLSAECGLVTIGLAPLINAVLKLNLNHA
jgi:hypothetical protein